MSLPIEQLASSSDKDPSAVRYRSTEYKAEGHARHANQLRRSHDLMQIERERCYCSDGSRLVIEVQLVRGHLRITPCQIWRCGATPDGGL